MLTYCGGDSLAVQEQLRGVQKIYSAGGAFAAVKEDRSVVTWGAAGYGGDSRAVQEQLRGGEQLCLRSHRRRMLGEFWGGKFA